MLSFAKVTHRLESHPCVITVAEMGAARHFLKTTLADKSEEERYRVLQPTLEVNPSHPIIRKLYTLKNSDPDLAKLVSSQVGLVVQEVTVWDIRLRLHTQVT